MDLYGGQVGGRLEDMRTFRKYIGGSPTNAAAGAARLSLKSAVITRVGDEHMGRFIREQLQAEGVDIRGVITDPHRLTALVLLGIRGFYRPDDTEELRADQETTVKRLAEAARANGLDFLLEIIPSKFGPVDESTTAAVIERFYAIGVFPDWWKLEPMVPDAAWQKACAVIEDNDPYCRGIVVLGLDAPFEDLRTSLRVAAGHDLVKGFAIGRTIFGDVARAWMAGNMADEEAVARMAENFSRLCEAWDRARAGDP